MSFEQLHQDILVMDRLVTERTEQIRRLVNENDQLRAQTNDLAANNVKLVAENARLRAELAGRDAVIEEAKVYHGHPYTTGRERCSLCRALARLDAQAAGAGEQGQ